MTIPQRFSLPDPQKNNLALFFIFCMLLGFLCSRALLSLSVVLFGVTALWGIHPRAWLKQKWWLLGLGWILCYIISWFWSDDKSFWLERVQTKLPFLLLPLAFDLLPPFTKKQLSLFTTFFCGLMLGGIGYSMKIFLKDPGAYIEGYRYSHVIPTPVYNDHISFSMALVVAVCWCIYILPALQQRWLKYFVIFSILVIVSFLHLLAAQTGILGIYIVLLALVIRLLWGKKKITGIISASALVLVCIFFWKNIGSFKNRLGHTYYAYLQFKSGNISGNYGDIGRIVSYQLALKMIKEHPVAGVGAGDVLDEIGKKYEYYYPGFPREQYLVPHNQFLVIACATGIFSAVLFLWWLCAPLSLVRRNRQGYYFTVVWVLMLLLLLINPTLEVQFGIFAFLFFYCWQRKELKDNGSLSKQLPNL